MTPHQDMAEGNRWAGVGERTRKKVLIRFAGWLARTSEAHGEQIDQEERLNQIVGATYKDGPHGEVIFSDALLLHSKEPPQTAGLSDGSMVDSLLLEVYPSGSPERGYSPRDAAMVQVIKDGLATDVVYAQRNGLTGDTEYARVDVFHLAITGYGIISPDGKRIGSVKQAIRECLPGGRAGVFLESFAELTEILPPTVVKARETDLNNANHA